MCIYFAQCFYNYVATYSDKMCNLMTYSSALVCSTCVSLDASYKAGTGFMKHT